MQSSTNKLETRSGVPIDYSAQVPTAAGQMKPKSRRPVAQPHVKTSGSHGRRESRGKPKIANPIPMASAMDWNTQPYRQNPTEGATADDGNIYEPIIESSEHTYQPLIPPKPLRQGVQRGGRMAGQYENRM